MVDRSQKRPAMRMQRQCLGGSWAPRRLGVELLLVHPIALCNAIAVGRQQAYIPMMDTIRARDLLAGYDPEKAEQVAAFFAIRAGGAISKLRLVKLIYLADRAFADRYDEPMLYDKLVSMPLGPVNSITLNLLNDELGQIGVPRLVEPPSHNRITLSDADLTVDDLRALSDAEIEVLEEVWLEHSRKSLTALLDYVHALPEWENPQGSSIDIPYEKLFAVLGKAHSAELERDIQIKRELSRALA
jgi:hypothetical protein